MSVCGLVTVRKGPMAARRALYKRLVGGAQRCRVGRTTRSPCSARTPPPRTSPPSSTTTVSSAEAMPGTGQGGSAREQPRRIGERELVGLGNWLVHQLAAERAQALGQRWVG